MINLIQESVHVNCRMIKWPIVHYIFLFGEPQFWTEWEICCCARRIAELKMKWERLQEEMEEC